MSASLFPLEQIVIDDRLQPRCDGLNEEHVETLMETPEEWPPIVVAHIDGSSVLVDGFHRHEAALRLGFESISATVFYPDTGTELLDIAFSLNGKHGRPLTLHDRKTFAAGLLQRHPELSDRELGRRCGLHHETIGGLRNGHQLTFRGHDRKPGALPSDVGVLDPIRFGKRATKDQKGIAGYVARLATALGDPYTDDSSVEMWPSEPSEIAHACIAAMGRTRACETFQSISDDTRFMLSVVKAAQTLLKEAAS